jgi:hypothetical protein
MDWMKSIKIIREEDLTKKDIGNVLPADIVLQPSQQDSSSSGAVLKIVRRGGGIEDDVVQHVINESED